MHLTNWKQDFKITVYILDWLVRAVRESIVPFPALVMAFKDTLYSEYGSEMINQYTNGK